MSNPIRREIDQSSLDCFAAETYALSRSDFLILKLWLEHLFTNSKISHQVLTDRGTLSSTQLLAGVI